MKNIQKPIIFDIGANIGDFSKLCLEIFSSECKIFAFEPASSTFLSYCDNLVSPIRNDIVVPINCGVSDTAGEVALYSSEPNSTIASVYQLERPIRPLVDELTETVRLLRIDEFCLERGINSIDFLKLDIEGHELAALHGAHRMISEGNVKFIQFEFGENNISSRTFMSDFNKILSKDYDIFRITPGGLMQWTYRGGLSEIFATMNYMAVRRPF